jgi:hypothetical protein
LNRQLSDAQIEQLIQSLRGIKPVENDILDEEKTENKEKMASYAEILKDDGKENENTNTNTKVIHPVKRSNRFACHAKLNPATTMTVCLPHYPYKYATYP